MRPYGRPLAALVLVTATAFIVSQARPLPRSLVRAEQDEASRQWHRLLWSGEDGRVPMGALAAAMFEREPYRGAVFADAGLTAGLSKNSWTWAGPSNIGGRVHDIVFHPTTPTTMFAGTNSGGIWRTTDGGASWTAISDDLPAFTVQSIRFQPGNPLVMYAATGSNVFPGAGILKSTDGGTTWAILPGATGFGFEYVNQLSLSANGQIILAATDQGVYRSTTGGTSWERTLRPPAPTGIVDSPALCSGDPAFLDWHCTAEEVRFLPGSSVEAVASLASGRVFHTADGGVTWQSSVFTPDPALYAAHVAFGTTPGAPALVYAAINAPGGVYRSTDGGRTFTRRCATCSAIGGGSAKNTLWIDPTNSEYVVMGGLYADVSRDGGVTFSRVRDVGHVDVYSVVSHPAFDGTSEKRVYLGNDGGVFVLPDVYAGTASADAATAVSLNNNLGNQEFYHAAADASGQLVVAGSQDNGVQRFLSSTGTVGSMEVPGDGLSTAVDAGRPGVAYLHIGFPLHVFRSIGPGQWEAIALGSSTGTGCNPAPYRIDDLCSLPIRVWFNAPMVLDPNDGERLYFGGARLWRTSDPRAAVTGSSGPSWSIVADALPIRSDATQEPLTTAVAIAQGSSSILWRALYDVGLAGNTSYVLKSVDATSATPTWSRVGSGTLPNRYPTSIHITPSNHQVVYLTFGGFAGDNLWRTTDGGESWQDVTGTGATGLPAIPIRSVTTHPDRAQWVYAGTEFGVFVSTDGGSTWSSQNVGPAKVPVTEFVWMGARLLISTFGRGLFTATPELPATTLSLSPAALRFAATKNGAAGDLVAVSPQQQVAVSSAGVVSTWTATSDSAWLVVTNGSGTGAGTFGLSIANPGNIIGSATSLSAVVTLTASGAETVRLNVQLTVTQQTGTTTGPTGQVDTPAQSATGLQGAIAMTGWVVDDVGIQHVRIYRQCLSFEPQVGQLGSPCQTVLGTSLVFVGTASVISGARPDVEALFPSLPANSSAGWGFLILSNLLPNIPASNANGGGVGTFLLYAVATDAEGNQKLLGRSYVDTAPVPTTVTVANDTIAKPFGAIDTPAQGATVSGTLNNFGWVLTPDSNTVADGTDILMPTTGATINVIVDGVSVGTATYNLCRGTVGNPVPSGTLCDDDVSGIFRAAGVYRNLDAARGPIGLRTINTASLSNGLHTIQWGATDSASRGEGIGSRYFTVLNSAGDGGAEAPPYGGLRRDASVGQAFRPAGDGGAGADVGQAFRPAVDGGAEAPPYGLTPLFGRTGFDLARAFVALGEIDGVPTIRVPEMGRVELQVPGAESVALVANGSLRSAPVGMTVDAATGTIAWSVGPGYLGTYRLRIEREDDQVLVDVTVAPMALVDEPLRMHLDRAQVEGPGLSERTVRVEGWALDPQAETGSGIGAVHVWARFRGPAVPASRSPEVPEFLGVADRGVARPDVAAAHGARFDRVGFRFDGTLPSAGEWEITAYVWNVRTQRFEDARTIIVVVR